MIQTRYYTRVRRSQPLPSNKIRWADSENISLNQGKHEYNFRAHDCPEKSRNTLQVGNVLRVSDVDNFDPQAGIFQVYN